MITQNDNWGYSLESLLDLCARELGCNTRSWVAAGSFYNTMHDDYAEFNHQKDYIMGTEFSGLFSRMWDEEVRRCGHGLDSYSSALVFHQAIAVAKNTGISMPDGREISKHVKERTFHEWQGC